MYNVLIVDDEALVRIGLKTSIDWEGEGFKITADLQDGDEAFDFIKKNNIDLVLLDIKMPKMDGIRLLTELKALDFKGRVIVLSSFDDYEYVRKALKLGAYDYLHKPSMGPQDISAILRSVKNEMDAEKCIEPDIGNEDEDIGTDKNIRKKELIKNFVLGNIKYSPELQIQFDRLGVNIKPGSFAVIIFDMDKKIDILEIDKEDIYISSGDYAENILKQAVRSYKNIQYFKLDDYKALLIYNTSSIPSSLEKGVEIRKFANEIKEIFSQFLNLSFTAGVSNFHDRLIEITTAIKEATASVAEKFYQGYGKTIFYSEVPKFNYDDSFTDNTEHLFAELRGCIEDGSVDRIKDCINEIIDLMNNRRLYSRKKVYHVAYDIISMQKDTFAKYGQLSLKNEAALFIERMNHIETIFELENKIIDFTIKATSILNKRLDEEYGNIINKVIKFINQRYSEDINLEAIACHVSMNPSYISRLFKQKTGLNITDYKTKIRMEKAKELLKDSSLKVYEISDKLGYYDYRYFSKLFKEYTDFTPQEFRQSK